MPPALRLIWLITTLIAGFIWAESAAAAVLSPANGNRIGFTASQMDVAVAGEFKTFHGDIDFDPARPEAGKANISIDLGSVATGSGDADTLLKSRDFFDSEHFPQVTFTTTRIRQDTPGHYLAQGRFTLKGHSSDLALPFTAKAEPGGLRLEGNLSLSRLAYQVGQGEWADSGTLADAVKIQFRLLLPR